MYKWCFLGVHKDIFGCTQRHFWAYKTEHFYKKSLKSWLYIQKYHVYILAIDLGFQSIFLSQTKKQQKKNSETIRIGTNVEGEVLVGATFHICSLSRSWSQPWPCFTPQHLPTFGASCAENTCFAKTAVNRGNNHCLFWDLWRALSSETRSPIFNFGKRERQYFRKQWTYCPTQKWLASRKSPQVEFPTRFSRRRFSMKAMRQQMRNPETSSKLQINMSIKIIGFCTCFTSEQIFRQLDVPCTISGPVPPCINEIVFRRAHFTASKLEDVK